MDTAHTCTYSEDLTLSGTDQQPTTTSGTLFAGDSAGSAASLLTLVTNISATILIGLKALYVCITLCQPESRYPHVTSYTGNTGTQYGDT